jgi:hypothetical protein
MMPLYRKRVHCITRTLMTSLHTSSVTLAMQLLHNEIAAGIQSDLIPASMVTTVYSKMSAMEAAVHTVLQLTLCPLPFLWSVVSVAIKLVMWMAALLSLFAVPMFLDTTLRVPPYYTPLIILVWTYILFGFDAIVTSMDQPFGSNVTNVNIVGDIALLRDELVCLIAARVISRVPTAGPMTQGTGGGVRVRMETYPLCVDKAQCFGAVPPKFPVWQVRHAAVPPVYERDEHPNAKNAIDDDAESVNAALLMVDTTLLNVDAEGALN